MNRFRATALLSLAWLILPAFQMVQAHTPRSFFVVRIVDEQTGRGVPLVELKLSNEVKYWTDSAGVAAIDEPSLRGQTVFLEIRSDGYEYPNEMPFGRGVIVTFEPGKLRQFKVRRTMIAERLYRLTGEGIYRDSVMAGLTVPSRQSLLNGKVMGQDTISAAIYRGKLFWIWGDTIGPSYWNFKVTAATSELSDDPDSAVNYRYFTDGSGR